MVRSGGGGLLFSAAQRKEAQGGAEGSGQGAELRRNTGSSDAGRASLGP